MTLHRYSHAVIALLVSCATCPHAQSQTTADVAPGQGLAVLETIPDGFLNLRSKPNASSAVITKLPAGTNELLATGKSAKDGVTPWIEVTIANKTGWLNSQYVRKLGVPVKPVVKQELPVATDPVSECNSDNPALKLDGCSKIIDEPAVTTADKSVALSRRADAYLAEARHDDAIADLQSVLALEPDHAEHQARLAEAFLQRARLRIAKSEWTDAISDLKEAATRSSDNAEPKRLLVKVLDRRALDFMLKKDFDPALTDYTEAISVNATLASLYVDRSAAYMRKNLDKESLNDLNKAIDLDPNLVEAYLKRGDNLASNGDLPGAVKDFDLVLKRRPKNTDALLRRGLAFEQMTKRVSAERDFKAVLKLEPSNRIAKDSLQRVKKMQAAENANSSDAKFNRMLQRRQGLPVGRVYTKE